jgi:hypothetical protein
MPWKQTEIIRFWFLTPWKHADCPGPALRSHTDSHQASLGVVDRLRLGIASSPLPR